MEMFAFVDAFMYLTLHRLPALLFSCHPLSLGISATFSREIIFHGSFYYHSILWSILLLLPFLSSPPPVEAAALLHLPSSSSSLLPQSLPMGSNID